MALVGFIFGLLILGLCESQDVCQIARNAVKKCDDLDAEREPGKISELIAEICLIELEPEGEQTMKTTSTPDVEVMTQFQIQTTMAEISQDHCRVSYRGMCFWYAVQDSNYEQKAALCAEVPGGRPAVVYDSEHYAQIQAYIRSLMTDLRTVEYFWLGLRYIPSRNEVVTLATEARAPFVQWHRRYPYSFKGEFTAVVMQVQRLTTSTEQGMYNSPPSAITRGVLCEATGEI